MRKILKVISAIVITLMSISLTAQDVHFSQYYHVPLFVNPALTGMFDGNQRFTAIARNQWRTVPVQYNTFSIGYDERFFENKMENNKFGSGITMYTDRAGDSKFSTTHINLLASYAIKMMEAKGNYFSIGLKTGFGLRSFDTGDLLFADQYDAIGGTINPGTVTADVFLKQNVTYFDLSTGLAWLFSPKESMNFTTGLSINHITSPKVAFNKKDETRLDMKFIIHHNNEIPVHNNIRILSGFQVSLQGKMKEIYLGSNVKYILNDAFGKYYAVYAGGWTRIGDAVTTKIGFEYNHLTLGFAYDINTSEFQIATGKRGASELSLVYILKGVKVLEYEKKVCPIF